MGKLIKTVVKSSQIQDIWSKIKNFENTFKRWFLHCLQLYMMKCARFSSIWEAKLFDAFSAFLFLIFQKDYFLFCYFYNIISRFIFSIFFPAQSPKYQPLDFKISRKTKPNQKFRDFCQMFMISKKKLLWERKRLGYGFKNLYGQSIA